MKFLVSQSRQRMDSLAVNQNCALRILGGIQGVRALGFRDLGFRDARKTFMTHQALIELLHRLAGNKVEVGTPRTLYATRAILWP